MLEQGRTFVDWHPGHTDRAAIALTQLAQPETPFDLSPFTVVTPGSRAARTTLASLIDLAEQRHQPLVPPLFVTPADVPALCLRTRIPSPAPKTLRRLAWIHTLRALPEHTLRPLIPLAPEHDDADAWSAIARWTQTTCEDLGAQALTPRAILNHPETNLAPTELERWTALADAHDAYLNRIHDTGHQDERAAAIDALENDPPRSDLDLVLLAVTELPRLTRRAIERTQTNTHAVVFAPEDHAPGFDDLGAVTPTHWLDLDTAVDDASIAFASTPTEMTRRALEHIAEHADTLDDAVAALADERVLPVLEHQAAIFGPTRVHSPAALSAQSSAPAQLLRLLRDHAAGPSLDTAAAIAQHPHAHAAIAPTTTDAVRAIQRLRTDHVQTRGTLIPTGTHPKTRDPAASLLDPLNTHLDPIATPGETRPIAEWSSRLRALLTEIYDAQPIDDRDAPVLDEIAAVLDQCDAAAGPDPLPVSVLFSILDERLAETRVKAAPYSDTLESLGWLELLHDPSPVAAVLGMSDTRVPRAPSRDPLLTLALRETLGLATPTTALARDLYLARAIDQSRDALFLAATTSPAGDPEPPSRVLLHAPPIQCAARVRRATEHPSAPPPTRLTPAIVPDDRDAFLPAVTVLPGYTPPTTMNVTDFDAYIRSPAGWYLARHLSLQDPDPAPREMDPRTLGNLAHDALERFGKDDTAKDLTSADDIKAALLDHLDAALHATFAAPRAAAVTIQAELLRHRLALFANAQAADRNAGWRITHAELRSRDLDTPPTLATNADPLELHAKLDRIDVHDDTGDWRVLDYKTGKPEDAHKLYKNDAWTKLQLPLYRHVTRAMGHPHAPRLGYINIPKADTDTVFSVARWDDDPLVAADAHAAQIVDDIRRLTPGDPVPLGDAPPDQGFMGFLTAERFKTAGRPAAPENADPDATTNTAVNTRGDTP